MNIVVVEKEVSLADLKVVAQEFYQTMIKGVVDIEKEVVAFGGEYHIDANQKLTERDSEQKNIWGFNVYLNRPRDTWIEYISLINIRPSEGNTAMEVSDPKIRERIKKLLTQKSYEQQAHLIISYGKFRRRGLAYHFRARTKGC